MMVDPKRKIGAGNMKEHLKLVVWPRPPTDENPHYRYVLVGMLIMDKPLEIADGKNDVILEGYGGISQNLEAMSSRQPDRVLGEATSVLLSLGDL